jgi:hypothetical protein
MQQSCQAGDRAGGPMAEAADRSSREVADQRVRVLFMIG